MPEHIINPNNLPTLLVSGASGLVGRNFIDSVKQDFYIYAIARKNQRDAGVMEHENIRWLRCDIGERQNVENLIYLISQETTIDFFFHFAGYYDFTYEENPEYQRTNVDGTQYLLENAKQLQIKRFIFSSSVAITDFIHSGMLITEKSEADADYPYAHSKRMAEELVKKYSAYFPCTIVRLAAIFSDWCEYGPLYILLSGWLKKGFKSKCIAGNGITAIPYLHVHDLNSFWLQIIKQNDRLSSFEILLASQDGCVSHNDLFNAAMKWHSDNSVKPVYVPLWLAWFGIIGIRFWGFLKGKQFFERLWMLQYVDKRMDIDAKATHQMLDWFPKQRLGLARRLLFLIENMKRNPIAWEQKNLAMANKQVLEQPGLKIYNAMISLKDEIIVDHIAHLLAPENKKKYLHYVKLERGELYNRAELVYKMLEASMLHGDRLHIYGYAEYLAKTRFNEGFSKEELCSALINSGTTIEEKIKGYPGLEDLQQRIHFEIGMTMQLLLDGIEDVYEKLENCT